MLLNYITRHLKCVLYMVFNKDKVLTKIAMGLWNSSFKKLLYSYDNCVLKTSDFSSSHQGLIFK